MTDKYTDLENAVATIDGLTDELLARSNRGEHIPISEMFSLFQKMGSVVSPVPELLADLKAAREEVERLKEFEKTVKWAEKLADDMVKAGEIEYGQPPIDLTIPCKLCGKKPCICLVGFV